MSGRAGRAVIGGRGEQLCMRMRWSVARSAKALPQIRQLALGMNAGILTPGGTRWTVYPCLTALSASFGSRW